MRGTPIHWGISGACGFGAEASRCPADASPSLADQCAGRDADAPLSLIPNQTQTQKATSYTSDVGLDHGIVNQTGPGGVNNSF